MIKMAYVKDWLIEDLKEFIRQKGLMTNFNKWRNKNLEDYNKHKDIKENGK